MVFSHGFGSIFPASLLISCWFLMSTTSKFFLSYHKMSLHFFRLIRHVAWFFLVASRSKPLSTHLKSFNGSVRQKFIKNVLFKLDRRSHVQRVNRIKNSSVNPGHITHHTIHIEPLMLTLRKKWKTHFFAYSKNQQNSANPSISDKIDFLQNLFSDVLILAISLRSSPTRLSNFVLVFSLESDDYSESSQLRKKNSVSFATSYPQFV